MNVKQNLSILFFPKNQKLNSQGKTTIYIRVTIDGLKDEFSSGIKVRPDQGSSQTEQNRVKN
ncbi:MAG: Arm DNA-binding domain-containing protein [Chitinophagaceae bacterium]